MADVAAAVRMHDKLKQLNPGSTEGLSFAATHPSSPEREARLTKTKAEIALKKAMHQEVLPQRRAMESKAVKAECAGQVGAAGSGNPACF